MQDRAYKIALNCKYDRYQRGLMSIDYKLFGQKTALAARGKANVNGMLAQ